MPMEIRELTIEFIEFEDFRWYQILGDSAGVILHVEVTDPASSTQYDWHFGWLLDDTNGM